MKRMGPKSIFE